MQMLQGKAIDDSAEAYVDQDRLIENRHNSDLAVELIQSVLASLLPKFGEF
jgi:hypothetical protein